VSVLVITNYHKFVGSLDDECTATLVGLHAFVYNHVIMITAVASSFVLQRLLLTNYSNSMSEMQPLI